MKPFAIYGKKPRASKTSKREVLDNIPVFLHFSNGSTGGNIVCYYDKPPYPRICVASGMTYWDCRSKIEEFFSKNSLDIKYRLENLDKNYGIPYDIMDKQTKLNDNLYDIFTEPGGKGFRLITPFIDGEYIYLYADPVFAPTKNIGGKSVLDSNAIAQEYLRRKNEM